MEDGARESLAGIFFCRALCKGAGLGWNAQQLAAEVFFQAGVNDLLAVVQILGADKADHCVDRKRIEVPGYRVDAGFACLLVDAVI